MPKKSILADHVALLEPMIKQPVLQLKLQTIFSLLGAPDLHVGKVQGPAAEVPVPLATSFDVFQQAL